MIEKPKPGGWPTTRKKNRPAFTIECARQVPVAARQINVACAQGISPALRGRWQRQAIAAAVSSSAERAEITRLRAALKRQAMERDRVKKVVTSFSQPPHS